MLLAGCLLGSLTTCKLQEAALIQPQSLGLPLTPAEARQWYEAQAGPVLPAATANRARPVAGTPAGPLPVKWTEALDTMLAGRPLVIVPLNDHGQDFTASGYQTYRYLLVARPSERLYEGAVVEVLLKSPAKPTKAAQRQWLARLYQHYRNPAGAPPADFTGFVFFYTQGYRYRAGRAYAQGRPQAGQMHLQRADSTNRSSTGRTNGCDTYLITSHDPPYTVSVCGGLSPYDPGDPGQPDYYDPGYGGGNTNSPNDPGSGPDGSGGSSSSAPFVSITPGNLRPCASKVVADVQAMANSSILNGGPVAQLIAAIAANPNIKVTINEQANLMKDGHIDRAQTTPGSTPGNYIIKFNSYFLSGPDAATDLAIASDLIHELLHVYMIDWAVNHNSDPNADFNSLMLFYTMQQKQEKNLSQHEIMTNLVGYMAQALQAYFLETFISSGRYSSIDLAYCEYIVWGGLQETDEYKNRAKADPDWAVKVVAYTQGERHPASRGATAGTIVINPRGSQACQ